MDILINLTIILHCIFMAACVFAWHKPIGSVLKAYSKQLNAVGFVLFLLLVSMVGFHFSPAESNRNKYRLLAPRDTAICNTGYAFEFIEKPI